MKQKTDIIDKIFSSKIFKQPLKLAAWGIGVLVAAFGLGLVVVNVLNNLPRTIAGQPFVFDWEVLKDPFTPLIGLILVGVCIIFTSNIGKNSKLGTGLLGKGKKDASVSDSVL